MFKLPNGIPGVRTDNQEWADYAEFNAIISQKKSFFSLLKPTSLISDEIVISGIEDESDKLSQKAEEIAKEIGVRVSLLNSNYPFDLEDQDYSLRYKGIYDQKNLIYVFLLLSTRIKMNANRIIKDIDGSLLFEQLCAQVAKEHFGIYSEVDIIGTSKEDASSFREKLEHIFSKVGEGGEIHENPGYQVKDDNVDIVVWINFTDKKPSKFIAFGQCKTGTSWVEKLSEMNTSAFCKRWFSRQPIITPMRMFFTAQYFPSDLWYERASEAGLVFDRIRIMNFLPETLDDELLNNIQTWCDGAFEIYN